MGYFSQALIDERDREFVETDFKRQMITIIQEAFPGIKYIDLIRMKDKQLRIFYGRAKYYLKVNYIDKEDNSYLIPDEERTR